MIPKIKQAQHLLQIFEHQIIENIVICPGSRNAPLTIGFANNPIFNCYSIVDERCGAFFALGMAQQTKKPVAVICTSGSALLNFYPAIAEAFYNQIPLIIVSADRPADKIDIGDGQTIRQINVFENHIISQVNLSENTSEKSDEDLQNAINICRNQKGPIHINIPFEEPLYETIEKFSSIPKLFSNNKIEKKVKWNQEHIQTIKKSHKVLIILGNLPPNTISEKIIDYWSKQTNFMVMTETLSNVYHSKFIQKIDVTISNFTKEEMIDFQPDVLITMGGMIVSKKVKTWLRNYKPNFHFHIDELRAYNTFHCLNYHFECTINEFWENYLKENYIKIFNNYQQNFLELKQQKLQKHNDYIQNQNLDFSDFKVFDFLSKNIPQNCHLQISNSSPIRYVQLFDFQQEMYCNRGTSGIDGSTSTAIGASIFNKKPTFFISGDLSFFYDSNALWNNYIPNNLKIILINNGGGGIFRILPGHQENQLFEQYFETQHQLDASHLASMFGFNYLVAHNELELDDNWKKLKVSNQKTILEIFTPTNLNEKILKNYFNSL